ncbi:DUF6088 family protein [Arabiibacter massiliensis]|uniref:DUF6088 family protein n=1 Tax=Arabiibacter massiliensis TaxID=1870985 RepID=UPI0009B93ABD|nr:DUF6088 family protein [Arabiibacter massiliensis]
MKNFDETLLERFGYDKPILPEDVISLFPDVTRAAVYQNIDASMERGFLERYKRGVYYIAQDGIFGKTTPSAEDVVERKYITDGDDVYGYYSGLTLENKVGVSTQVPAVLEITTNKSSRWIREVKPFGGWRKIVIRKPRTEVSRSNVDALMFLDLITRRPPSSMDSYELRALKALAAKAGRDKVAECAACYPGKTSKMLLESEACGVFA